MKIHKDIIQGTDEWLALRIMRMTGSNASAIGNCGAGLKTYITKLMCGAIVKQENYISKDMERGNRLEPLARLEYQFKTGREITEVGFVSMNKYVGVSPDGLHLNNSIIEGGIEIKAKNDENHFEVLKTDKVDSGTVWQSQMNMLVTGALWWDFVSFNVNFKESCKIIRILPDEVKFNKLEKGFVMGVELIEEIKKSDFFKREYEKTKSSHIKEMV